jgi:hypothetical protein
MARQAGTLRLQHPAYHLLQMAALPPQAERHQEVM